MKKCKCGFKTWSNRRYKKHIRKCDFDGRKTEEVNTEGYEVEAEQAEETPFEEKIEGPDYESMNVLELRRIARAAGIANIYSFNKSELIEAIKEGG